MTTQPVLDHVNGTTPDDVLQALVAETAEPKRAEPEAASRRPPRARQKPQPAEPNPLDQALAADQTPDGAQGSVRSLATRTVATTTARRWRPDPGVLDQIMDVAIAVGLGILILVGFATSYRTLRDLAATEGDYPLWLAPAVPLSFDLGIIVLSLKVIRAAREGRSAPVLRLIVATLSAATVAANASAADTLAARVLHAVPPAMFVICFESVVITARRHALAHMGLLPEPLPRLRAVRWVLAPVAAAQAWRALVLVDPVSPRHEEAGATEPPAPLLPLSDSHAATSPRRERSVVVREALRQDPALSAPALAAVLEHAGHRVSVRTAQRLRSAEAAHLAR